MEEEEPRGNAIVIEKGSPKPTSTVYITRKSGDPPFKKFPTAITLKKLYGACVIRFFNARHCTDNFKWVGIEGNKNGGTLFDAREIYYDTELCFHRIESFIKNAKEAREEDRNKSSQNLQIYKMLLANTDTFILSAFVFTCLLTKEKFLDHKYTYKDAISVLSKERHDPNLVRSVVGQTIYAKYTDALKNDKRSIFYGLDGANTRREIEDEFKRMSVQRIMLMFDAYQFDLSKQAVSGAMHQEYIRRRGNRPAVQQNAENLFHTLTSLFNSKERLDRAFGMLDTMLNVNDPFVSIYRHENMERKLYDNGWRVEYDAEPGLKKENKDKKKKKKKNVDPNEIVADDDGKDEEGIETRLKGIIVWRVWELYQHLRSYHGLHFNQVMWDRVLSRESNDVITMEDMDALLYDATLPFYYRANDFLLSQQFHMAYDFCFLLREQHRRYGNALQYMKLLIELAPLLTEWHKLDAANLVIETRRNAGKAKTKNASSPKIVSVNLSKNDDYMKRCGIEIPFDSLMADVTGRFPHYREISSGLHRILDDKIVDDIIKGYEEKYPGVSYLFYHLRGTMLRQSYLYNYVIEFVYPRFGQHLWGYVIGLYKTSKGLYGDTPVFLSAPELTLVMDELIPGVKTRLLIPPLDDKVFDSHFKVALISEGRVHITGGVDFKRIQGTLEEELLSLFNNDNNIIRRLVKEVVVDNLNFPCHDNDGDRSRSPDTPRKQVEQTLLAYIMCRVLENDNTYGVNAWSVCQSRILRRDISTFVSVDPSVFVDQSMIDMIESHPSCYNIKIGEDGDYEFPNLEQIQCVSFVDTVKQNLINYNKVFEWAKKTSEEEGQIFESFRLICDIRRHTTNMKASSNRTIKDLKLNMDVNPTVSGRYLILLREVNPSTTVYHIINDMTTYDTRFLSDVDVMENVFIIAVTSQTLPIISRPMIIGDIPDVVDATSALVIVETRRRLNNSVTMEILDMANNITLMRAKQIMYGRYTNCIECTIVKHGVNTMILVVCEELGDIGCLYDASVFIQCTSIVERYWQEQRSLVQKYKKKSDVASKTEETKQGITPNPTSNKKKGNVSVPTSQSSSSLVMGYGAVLDLAQKKAIREIYNANVTAITKGTRGKRDYYFRSKRSVRERLDEVEKAKLQYIEARDETRFAFRVNLTEANLRTNSAYDFRELLRSLEHLPEGDPVVDSIMKKLDPMEAEIVKQLMTQHVSPFFKRYELIRYDTICKLILDEMVFDGVDVSGKAVEDKTNAIPFDQLIRKGEEIEIKLSRQEEEELSPFATQKEIFKFYERQERRANGKKAQQEILKEREKQVAEEEKELDDAEPTRPVADNDIILEVPDEINRDDDIVEEQPSSVTKHDNEIDPDMEIEEPVEEEDEDESIFRRKKFKFPSMMGNDDDDDESTADEDTDVSDVELNFDDEDYGMDRDPYGFPRGPHSPSDEYYDTPDGPKRRTILSWSCQK